METVTSEQLKRWESLQNEMAKNFNETDRLDINNVRYILSIYLYIDPKDERNGVVAYSVCDYSQGEYGLIVKTGSIKIKNTIPYITGFLGFREVKFYKLAYDECCKNFKEPDILIINSYGKFHYRKAGSAVQLAQDINKPVIGIGRSIIYMDGLNETTIKKQFRKLCLNAGEYLYIKGKSGNIYGAAVKTSEKTGNPLYVSVGSYISLVNSIEIIINICKTRFPEPMIKAEMIAKNEVFMSRK